MRTFTHTRQASIGASSGTVTPANIVSLIISAKPLDPINGTKEHVETTPRIFLYDPQKPLMDGDKPYCVSYIAICQF